MALDPVVQNQGYQQLLDILFGDIEFLMQIMIRLLVSSKINTL